jgi:hypothetical protein
MMKNPDWLKQPSNLTAAAAAATVAAAAARAD